MSSYPILLDLKEKKAIVVGGGQVATRKVEGLLESHAIVTVISPEISETIDNWVQAGRVTYFSKSFEPGDEQEAFIVIAATNHREVNQSVADNVREGQLLNVVDQPELGNVQLPARVRRGKLTLTVSTGGASPLLAKQIQSELLELYPEDYETYLDFLAECRVRIKQYAQSPEMNRQLLQALLDPIYRDLEVQQVVLNDFKAFKQRILGFG